MSSSAMPVLLDTLGSGVAENSSDTGATGSEANMATAEPARRSGSFPPSAWDYNKIMTSGDEGPASGAINSEEHQMLRKEIIRLLKVTMVPLEKLELVDSLQQLGIRYHFEEEIQQVLDSIAIEASNIFSNFVDIYPTTLLFKVLRENGYQVSQDVFKRFICPKDGFTCFSKNHGYDIKGILSLYEASFLGFEGEQILDMARLLAPKYLKAYVDSKKMEPKLEKQVRHALMIPLYWRLARIHALWSIHINDDETNMNPIILQFAKMDYNLLQEIHKKEIGEITRWWNNLSLRDELNFARDRIVESYIWTMGVLFQPKYGQCRKYLTQAISLLTVIDDIYDVYGSINELETFTKAIERWDVNAIESLPKYMKICFLALFNMVNESSYHILKDKNMIVSPYLKKLWENLCKSYMVESKWYHNRKSPPLKEYIKNGSISSGVQLALSYIYIFTSQEISKEVLDFLLRSPMLINLTGEIFRLNNDLSTSNEELKRGDVFKAVECCQQERGISRSEAQLHIQSIIMDNWKKINAERYSPFIPKDMVNYCINCCQASHCFYQRGDGYGSPSHDLVKSMLFDGV